jgi:hypothetical protein
VGAGDSPGEWVGSRRLNVTLHEPHVEDVDAAMATARREQDDVDIRYFVRRGRISVPRP